MNSSSTVSEILRLEERHSVLGCSGFAESKPASMEHSLWLSEIREWNARKSEALALSTPSLHPLLQLRSMIFRGRIAEASSAIDALRWDELPAGDRVELLVERARLEHSRSGWALALELIDEALSLSPPGITQMTLHQMRSVSQFELGDLSAALDSCSKAESLAEIFPHSSSVPYIHALKAKVSGRIQGPQSGIDILLRTWSVLRASDTLTADAASSLLRAEVDVRRLAGLDSLHQAIAYCRIETVMAEDLYAALGLLDTYLAGSDALKKHLMPSLSVAMGRFERVRRGFDERMPSEGMENLSPMGLDSYRRAIESDFLVVKGLLIRIQPWTVISLEENPKIQQAIGALRPGAMTQKKLIEQIWKIKTISREKHGGLIPGLAYRLKKMLGAPVLRVESEVSFPGAFYVD